MGKDLTEVRSLQRKLTPDKRYVGLDSRERTSLQGIAKRAQACKSTRFQNLYGMIDEGMLIESWRRLNKKAAKGVDGITAQAYEKDLYANIKTLAQKLKTKRYRTKHVRRCYIPKDESQVRALGIPALEDKLVQHSCARILTSIYEQDFLPMSFGYRPERSAQEAISHLGFNLQFSSLGYVVEADIKNYFDEIDHDLLLEMLRGRVDDRAFLGLIEQWLKAGILDTDGEVFHPKTGSPQGGIVSPILANVYLHHVMDVWFETVVKPHISGKAMMIRYADDFVCAFQYKTEAVKFFDVLPKRLSRFGLRLSKEKSRLMRFSRFEPSLCHRIEFLGFELYWDHDYNGRVCVMKRTARKKLFKAIASVVGWVKANRHVRGRAFVKGLNRRLVGHYNYFGFKGNESSVGRFYKAAVDAAFKWLNRRGGKKSSFTWVSFREGLSRAGIARPRTTVRQRKHVVFT